MKLFCLSREGYLKGLLLLALIANLTWEPLTKHFSEVELASTQAARLDCTGKDKGAAACQPVSGADRAKMVDEAARIRAEVGANTGGKVTAQPKVSATTEAKATEVCKDCLSKEEQSKIARLNEEIRAITNKTASTSTTTVETQEVVERPSVERIKNCEIAADGDALTDMEALKCQTRLLATLKARGDSSRRKEVTRKIEDLVKDLRKDAKEDVFAKDSDRRNKGERTITDLIATLGTVRFDRDSDRTEMIGSLEALRAGADARVAAADLEEDVADLETEMKSSWKDLNKLTRDFQNSCRTRTGCDRDIYDQIQDQNSRVGELREEHSELAQTIKEEQDEAIDSLDDYRESMTRTELRDYTAPFAKLKSRMETMVDARKLGASNVGNQTSVDAPATTDSGLPTDFYDVRNGNTALRRGNGMYQAPVMNNQVPMGSPQAINNQMMQQPYSPQYMQPGMQMPGQQGQSLLPSPGGMGMNQMMGNNQVVPVGGMAMNPMMQQPQMMNRPQVVPVPGQQQYGQQQYGQQYVQPYMNQQPQVLPAPRF